MPVSPLSASVALLAAWAAIGIAGLLRPGSVAFAGRALFLAGALVSLGLLAVGLAALLVAIAPHVPYLPAWITVVFLACGVFRLQAERKRW